MIISEHVPQVSKLQIQCLKVYGYTSRFYAFFYKLCVCVCLCICVRGVGTICLFSLTAKPFRKGDYYILNGMVFLIEE